MRILGFGTYDITKHPRVGIVLEGLRADGDDIVEANAPVGFSTAERVAMLQKPWTAVRIVPRILRSWRTIIRQARRAGRNGRWDAVVVGYLGHFDVLLARALFPRDTIVLDLLIFAADTARDRGIDSRLKLKSLALLDSMAIRCADVVMVDTAEHAAHLPRAQQHKGVVVAVGASSRWFDAGGHGAAGVSPAAAPLQVVFFGHFTPLQGTAVIGEALGELAESDDIEITMIGQGQEWELARGLAVANSHVTWVDWVEPDDLPTLVAARDVCLGIFGTGPKALRVVPNKVYQGAAAGCAIVTSGTAPQRRLLGDAAVFVPPGDPTSLADALRRLSADRPLVSAMRQAARRRSLDEFTASAVVTPLRKRLAVAVKPRRTADEPF